MIQFFEYTVLNVLKSKSGMHAAEIARSAATALTRNVDLAQTVIALQRLARKNMVSCDSIKLSPLMDDGSKRRGRYTVKCYSITTDGNNALDEVQKHFMEKQ